MVCEGLPSEMATRLGSCAEFLTTTTAQPTTTRRTRRTTKKVSRPNVINSRHGVASRGQSLSVVSKLNFIIMLLVALVRFRLLSC